MLAILRVHGKEMEISTMLALMPIHPYRIDEIGRGRASTNCLHYDTESPEDTDFNGTMEKISSFLRDNEKYLRRIRKRSDVDGVVLDIGAILQSDAISATYHLEIDQLAQLTKLGLSIEISVYKEGGE